MHRISFSRAQLGVFVAIFSTLALIKVATILVDNHERKQQVRHQMEACQAVSRSVRLKVKSRRRCGLPQNHLARRAEAVLQVPKNPFQLSRYACSRSLSCQAIKRHCVNSVKASSSLSACCGPCGAALSWSKIRKRVHRHPDLQQNGPYLSGIRTRARATWAWRSGEHGRASPFADGAGTTTTPCCST